MEKIIENYRENLPEKFQQEFLRLETMKEQYLKGNTSEIYGNSLNKILNELDVFYILAIKSMEIRELFGRIKC